MNDFFLADDLSGALDAGAAFLRTGRRVRIAVTDDAWTMADADDVMAITTETRNANPSHAAATVAHAITTAQAKGGRLLYKKIDSTLRGPVGAELHALMEALPGVRILFAPANPRVGRTVVSGELLVNGVPVAQTDFGRDPTFPLQTSSIRQLLGPAATSRVVIPDVMTEADLETATQQMDATPGPWVAVGSGALAITVARRVRRDAAARPRRRAVVPASPIVMIGGSAHPLNRGQAQELRTRHGVPIHELSFGSVDAGVAAATGAAHESGGVTVQLPASRTTPAVALRVIVAAASQIIKESNGRRIFATGGETAFALCQQLGINGLELVAEVEPGLSVSLGYSDAGPVLLAVKPGGFGDTQTWVRAWEALAAMAES